MELYLNSCHISSTVTLSLLSSVDGAMQIICTIVIIGMFSVAIYSYLDGLVLEAYIFIIAKHLETIEILYKGFQDKTR